MAADLVYVVHPEPAVAETLSRGLRAADYEVVSLSSVGEVRSNTSDRQFMIPDAILTPLGDAAGDDSILFALFQSSPLMEQIPLVVVASSEREERRRALRMGLLSVVYPPYDGEEVALTTKLAIDKHRSDQLLFGSLSQLSVPDLLQTAEAGRRSGTVSFQHNAHKGTVWMRDGFVIDAEVVGESRGEEAVYAIALWTTGTFEANFGKVEAEERFRIPPSTLLLEAMRRFDEESAANLRLPEPEPIDAEVVDLSLIVLNVVAGYALNHLRPALLRDRLESLRSELAAEHPLLGAFSFGDEATVAFTGAGRSGVDEVELVAAVRAFAVAFFDRMEGSLAWRFGSRRLAGLLGPWRPALEKLGFIAPLQAEEIGGEDRGEVAHEAPGVAGRPVPVGCLELDPEGRVAAFSAFGPRIGRVDPAVVMRRFLNQVLPIELADLHEQLRARLEGGSEGENVAVGRTVLDVGHQSHIVRMAVLRPASQQGSVVVINRLRHDSRSLSPEIVRDPVTGCLRDCRTDRLLVVNDDFLHAFEDLFSRSLRHRHHELMQRFGTKWGLRHAARLEQIVQRDFGMTLREMESQMALELLSSSLGLFGLGRFDADLGYRDQGIVVIRHQASPFPATLASAGGGACSILAGFHAATLSYLAGRHLAAREVRCATAPGETCIFVIGTEDRLTKMLIATPCSADHALLEEIRAHEPAGGER